MKIPRTREGQLRQKLRRYNGQLLLLSFLSAALSLVLWGGAYVLGYWVLLFALSVAYGGEARMPAKFNVGFALVAAILFGLALLARRLDPYPRLVDKKSGAAIALDLLLALPRLTLAVRDHLAAWQSLTARELREAIHLLDCIRAARRFPTYSLPVEVPDERSRERILLALFHLEMVEMGHDRGLSWLRLTQSVPRPEISGPKLE